MRKVLALIFACMLFTSCAYFPRTAGEAEHALTEVEVRPESPGVPQSAPTPEPAHEPAPEPTPYVPPRYLADTPFIVECNEYINLRAEASTNAQLIGELTRKERVMVLEYSARYARVQSLESGREGYVIAGYLRPEADVLSLSVVSVREKYGYDDLLSDIAALEEKYPALVQKSSIGKSVRGRDIPVLTLGDPQAAHHVLLAGGLAGRDAMTSLLVMALFERAAQLGGYVDVCVHFVPMPNPDGVEIARGDSFDREIWKIYSNDYGMELTRFQGLEYLRNWRANANGVDLGRNFPVRWERGKSTQPSLSGYKGKAPLSEPESRALAEYVQSTGFDAVLSLSATGSQLYWQFGKEDSPSNIASRALAERIAALSAYTLQGADASSFGGFRDWVAGVLGIPAVSVVVGTREAPLAETDFYNIWLRLRDMLEEVSAWVREN